MTHNSILLNIAKHIVLNKEEIEYFISKLEFKKVAKKESLLKEGQPCKYIYYVHSGATRAYYLDTSGKESTIMFAVEDWWITDMYCFLNEKLAMVSIDALENTDIFQLKKSDLDTLYLKIPKFERFFRILMQNAYTREQLRIIENLSLSAEERYNSFIRKYPHIIQQVTQKQIASYLGITPEFLSTIRKKKSKPNIS